MPERVAQLNYLFTSNRWPKNGPVVKVVREPYERSGLHQPSLVMPENWLVGLGELTNQYFHIVIGTGGSCRNRFSCLLI